MTRNYLAFFLSIAFGLAACARAPTPAPTPVTLRVEATDLTAPLLFDLAAAYAEVTPNVFLDVSLVPLSTLNSDLAAGQADLGLAATHDPGQFATPVGYVSFEVVVHPSNMLTRLSAAQLPEIFASQISSWAQVSGSHTASIQVVSREPNSDAAAAFGAEALRGAATTTNSALVAPTWAAMREAVSQDPNAIGYLPQVELDQTIKVVEVGAPIRALVVAVAPGEPTGSARDFLAWAQSEAGQKVVGEKYERVKPSP